METLGQNLKYGIRMLARSPGFAAVAVVTLALGIGANIAIFSVLEGVILSPLPYGEPDRLVLVALYNRSLKYATDLSYPDFLDWRRDSRSLEQIAAFKPQGFDLSSPGSPEQVDGQQVSSNFFSTLGVKLALGRDLSPQEDLAGGPPAVIISNRLWQDRFAASPEAIGKTLTLDGVDFTIVGVLRPEFRFGRQPADVYAPIGRFDPLFRSDRTVHDILCVARLAPGVSIGQAAAEMNAIQEHIDRLNPATERGLGVDIDSLKHEIAGDLGSTLLLLLGAVGLVLLIACANIANLLLARSAARTREFAVRLALGAGRAQIVCQLVTESVLLSLIGGVLGVAIAEWGLSALMASVPGRLPRADNIGVNLPVLLFALGVSMMVGILFGLLPAFKSSNTDLQEGLNAGSRGSVAGHGRAQGVLLVLQVALTLVLLMGGSLLFRTIQNLWAVDTGFDTRHVITFQVGLSPTLANTASRIRTAYQQLAERIRQVSGVEAADITALVPFGQGANEGPFWVGPSQPASMAEIPRAIYYPIGPDYFRTMEIPLVRGRFLTPADDVHSEPVLVIDSLMARTYFPDRDPVGQSLTIPHWGATRNLAIRIVGVVRHVEHYGLDGSIGEKPQIYYSFYQLPDQLVPAFRAEVNLAVRTKLDAATVMPAIRHAVYQSGSDQPVYNIHTMEELVSGSMVSRRFPMILLSAFAALALLLASVGIYGVISYSMSRRVREIGIRMALGAVNRDVLRMVVGQGLRLVLAGLAIGAAAALILARMLSSFSRLLYGVRAADPLTFTAVSLLLIGAALLACYIPARRAANADPIAALRQE
jgi:predicted permease